MRSLVMVLAGVLAALSANLILGPESSLDLGLVGAMVASATLGRLA